MHSIDAIMRPIATDATSVTHNYGIVAKISLIVYINSKWSKNFDDRPHHRGRENFSRGKKLT